MEAKFIEVNTNCEKRQCTYNELLEYDLVLQKVCKYYFHYKLILHISYFHNTSVLLFPFHPFLFRLVNFFHTAQMSAVVQQRESEGQQSAEASLENSTMHY
jgi:hypothetical protein